MQVASGFGRRGLTPAPSAASQTVAAPAPLAADGPEPGEDEALASFQASARADWAQARKDRPRIRFWKAYPGMTALGAMSMVFLLITLAPLHMSMTALHWIRGGLGVSSLFGFGAKRLFRKKQSA